jgi:hypothetical protein
MDSQLKDLRAIEVEQQQLLVQREPAIYLTALTIFVEGILGRRL